MSSPKMLPSEEVRQRILDMLKSGPKRTIEFTHAIYPGAPTQTPDKAPSNWSSQVSTQVRRLEQSGLVEKTGDKNRFSPWGLRTKPQVDDLPANPQKTAAKRTHHKAHTNGHSNGQADGFRAYLIREIRMKLDELERLA